MTRDLLLVRSTQISVQMTEMIPRHMHEHILRWLWDGVLDGDFLTAVFENDLQRASVYADNENADNLAGYGRFLTFHMPVMSCGSKQNVEAWREVGGWNGMLKRQTELGDG